ncbi:ABC transporter substrate-binding protein [Alcaligenaceae bacterium CGII-47]|nr:ABC transporter substrate-binding protein [Alcaligenaceae bacterium CGII-47]
MSYIRTLTPLLHSGRSILLGLALGLSMLAPTQAALPVDTKAVPNDFMEAVANNMLNAVKNDTEARNGNTTRIHALVEQYALPYIDMTKTTRLSTGRYWKQASAEQQRRLVDAFTGTLIRTYSGAFTRVDQISKIEILPFRGDPEAKDAVVRSTLSQRNGPSAAVDYRLERTDAGWKIYDLNVEGIWLIQNYRNQFAQEINRNGIDGLIKALEQRNQ